jgi:hypothetical protein
MSGRGRSDASWDQVSARTRRHCRRCQCIYFCDADGTSFGGSEYGADSSESGVCRYCDDRNLSVMSLISTSIIPERSISMDVDDDELRELLDGIGELFSDESCSQPDGQTDHSPVSSELNYCGSDPSSNQSPFDPARCDIGRVLIDTGNSIKNSVGYETTDEVLGTCSNMQGSQLDMSYYQVDSGPSSSSFLMIPVDSLAIACSTLATENKAVYRQKAILRWRAKRRLRSSGMECSVPRAISMAGESVINKKRQAAMQKLRVNGRFVSRNASDLLAN